MEVDTKKWVSQDELDRNFEQIKFSLPIVILLMCLQPKSMPICSRQE